MMKWQVILLSIIEICIIMIMVIIIMNIIMSIMMNIIIMVMITVITIMIITINTMIMTIIIIIMIITIIIMTIVIITIIINIIIKISWSWLSPFLLIFKCRSNARILIQLFFPNRALSWDHFIYGVQFSSFSDFSVEHYGDSAHTCVISFMRSKWTQILSWADIVDTYSNQ